QPPDLSAWKSMGRFCHSCRPRLLPDLGRARLKGRESFYDGGSHQIKWKIAFTYRRLLRRELLVVGTEQVASKQNIGEPVIHDFEKTAAFHRFHWQMCMPKRAYPRAGGYVFIDVREIQFAEYPLAKRQGEICTGALENRSSPFAAFCVAGLIVIVCS